MVPSLEAELGSRIRKTTRLASRRGWQRTRLAADEASDEAGSGGW